VIITIENNQKEIESLLDNALLTETELNEGVDKWKAYIDNFPKWEVIIL
jgi:hypothetical protein